MDFGARIYDSRIIRWYSVDNYNLLYPNYSGYQYSLNNPISLKDIDGNLIVDAYGNPIYTEKKGFLFHWSEKNNEQSPASLRKYYSNDGKELLAWKFNGKKYQSYDLLNFKRIEDLHDRELYDCHAYVLIVSRTNDKVWIASKVNVNGEMYEENIKNIYLNENEYKPIDINDIEKGDIAVFFDSEGNILHSSIYIKDDVYKTKNDVLNLDENASLKSQIERYDVSYVNYYRKNEDIVISDLKTKNGKVSIRRMDKILKQLNEKKNN